MNWNGHRKRMKSGYPAGGYAINQPVVCSNVCHWEKCQWADKLEG